MYEYRYDSRGHLVEKKIPNAEPIIMVYDVLDRLVLTQDGKQRTNGKWSFTKYDELSRPIQSGITTVSSVSISTKTGTATQAGNSRHTISNVTTYLVPSSGYDLYETPNSSSESYTNNAFPNTTDILSVTYYDDYDFNDDGTNDYSFASRIGVPASAQFTRTKGKLIGTKVKVLDGGNTWLHTITFYDKYGRVIQVKGEHHLSGEDLTTTRYDFSGKVLETERKHTKSGKADLLINNKFGYDHAGRVLYHDLYIDEVGGASPKTIRLTENEYNELSQLIEKKLHSPNNQTFLQNVDYKYNLRGWLTDINDIEFGVITATELQDQLVNGLVTQITNGNIEVELDGTNEEIAIEEGGEEETINMEVDQTSAIISALNGSVNIGNIGTINESNIDQALATLETQLNTALINMGINDATTVEMIKDEVLYFYQNKWLTTVANDNDNDLFAMHFDYTQSNNILNVNGRYDGNITGMTPRNRDFAIAQLGE